MRIYFTGPVIELDSELVMYSTPGFKENWMNEL